MSRIHAEQPLPAADLHVTHHLQLVELAAHAHLEVVTSPPAGLGIDVTSSPCMNLQVVHVCSWGGVTLPQRERCQTMQPLRSPLLGTSSLPTWEGGSPKRSLVTHIPAMSHCTPNRPVQGILTREDGLPQEELRHHAAHRPHVNGRRVVCRTKDQLRRPVVPAGSSPHEE